jgi:hypothetical protein
MRIFAVSLDLARFIQHSMEIICAFRISANRVAFGFSEVQDGFGVLRHLLVLGIYWNRPFSAIHGK